MLALITLIGITLFLQQRFRELLGILPFVALASSIVVLFFGALLGHLGSASTLLFLCGLTCFAWVAITAPSELRVLVKPSLSIWIAASILLLEKARVGHYQGMDEFTFWGLVTKQMLVSGRFVQLGDAVDLFDNAPGCSLFQAFFVSLGRVAQNFEGETLAAQVLLLLTPLAVLFHGLEWRRDCLKIFTLVVTIPCVINTWGQGYSTIYVDQIVSVFFAAMLVSYVLLRDRFMQRYYLLLPLLFSLCSIREGGETIALFCIAFMAFDQVVLCDPSWHVVSTKRARVLVPPFLTLFAGPLLFKRVWEFRLKIFNLPRRFDSSNAVADLGHILFGHLSADQQSIILTFKIKMLHLEGHSILLLTCLFGLIVCGTSSSVTRRRLGSIYAAFGVFWIAFSLALISVYIYHFRGIQGQRLDSFDRYMNLLVAAIALTGLGFLKETRPFVSLTLLAIVPLLSGIHNAPPINQIVNIGPFYKVFNIEPVDQSIFNLSFLKQVKNVQNVPGKLYRFISEPIVPYDEARERLTRRTDVVRSATSLQDKIWFIHQHDAGMPQRIARFELFPRHVEGWCWAVGTPFGPKDYWTCPYSSEDWAALLRVENYQYVVLDYVDAAFIKQFANLFAKPDQIRSYFLFRVLPKGEGSVTLVGVKLDGVDQSLSSKSLLDAEAEHSLAQMPHFAM